MANAKFYTYRNLNGGKSFSVKHHGKVTVRIPTLGMVRNGTFQVSEAGRERVIREQARNVHAYVASDTVPVVIPRREYLPSLDKLMEVKYNPYRHNTFYKVEGEEPITSAVSIYFIDGRCYVDR